MLPICGARKSRLDAGQPPKAPAPASLPRGEQRLGARQAREPQAGGKFVPRGMGQRPRGNFPSGEELARLSEGEGSVFPLTRGAFGLPESPLPYLKDVWAGVSGRSPSIPCPGTCPNAICAWRGSLLYFSGMEHDKRAAAAALARDHSVTSSLFGKATISTPGNMLCLTLIEVMLP